MKNMMIEEGDVMYYVDGAAIKKGAVKVLFTADVIAVSPTKAHLRGFLMSINRALEQRGDWLVSSKQKKDQTGFWVFENEAVKDAKRRQDLRAEIMATDLTGLSAARLECVLAIIKP